MMGIRHQWSLERSCWRWWTNTAMMVPLVAFILRLIDYLGDIAGHFPMYAHMIYKAIQIIFVRSIANGANAEQV